MHILIHVSVFVGYFGTETLHFSSSLCLDGMDNFSSECSFYNELSQFIQAPPLGCAEIQKWYKYTITIFPFPKHQHNMM